jgi:cell division protein FtsB
MFLVFFCFIDSYNLIRQLQLKSAVTRLEEENQSYREKIKALDQKLADLRENKEKVARERYFYKGKDEDLIIIENE